MLVQARGCSEARGPGADDEDADLLCSWREKEQEKRGEERKLEFEVEREVSREVDEVERASDRCMKRKKETLALFALRSLALAPHPTHFFREFVRRLGIHAVTSGLNTKKDEKKLFCEGEKGERCSFRFFFFFFFRERERENDRAPSSSFPFRFPLPFLPFTTTPRAAPSPSPERPPPL